MNSSTTYKPSSVDEGQVLAAVDLAPIRVEHPVWCAGDCPAKVANGGIREMVHDLDAFELDLEAPRDVIDTETFPDDHWAPMRHSRAVVALVRIDYWGPDGTRQSDGHTDVVLDGPEGVTCLSPAEAARLGAALIRAARQARPNFHVACPEHGGAHCEECDCAWPCSYARPEHRDARSR